MSAYLQAENVMVEFREQRVLKGLSLDVARGEIVAVLGPSGCGKTTLLRCFAGLQELDGGRILVDGVDQDGIPSHLRGMGMMFQDHVLFPHMSVAENVAFGMKMRKVSVTERRERVAEILATVGLADFGDRAVQTLSGGEAQRVALARALAPSPTVLLLDEPLGSLDRIRRDELIDELHDLLAGLEQTAIHVTHDQDEAFTIADRIVVMRSGEIEQIGSPAEIWSQPQTEFVARFVGHPNVWKLDNGQTVMVPVSAIREDRGAPTEVVVERVRFAGGRWRVQGRALALGHDVAWLADNPHHLASTVKVRIDLEMAVELRP